jgi:hypothetical protein
MRRLVDEVGTAIREADQPLYIPKLGKDNASVEA